MKKSNFPPEWDENRVHYVLNHYEKQTDEVAIAEDEAAYASFTVMEVPKELVSRSVS